VWFSIQPTPLANAQARQLVRGVYGNQDVDHPTWEVLAASDLESEDDQDDESFQVEHNNYTCIV
jgi:hypothetical protein